MMMLRSKLNRKHPGTDGWRTKMGCKLICIVDIGIRKCCMECEKHEECNILCDDLDQYEYMEECPDYVKENEDENCKR